MTQPTQKAVGMYSDSRAHAKACRMNWISIGSERRERESEWRKEEDGLKAKTHLL